MVMHATREEHVGLTNKRTTRHPLSHQLSASNERIATMGNCMTCLRSPDADSEPAGASGQRAHKSDATVLDTVLGCTAGGIASGAGAAIADHVSERSERDGLLSQSPQHFVGVSSTDGHPGVLRKPEQGGSLGTASGNANNLPDTSAQSVKEPQVSDNTLNALFEEYKDELEDAILADGIERLCADLGYRPDDFAILVLAWRLDASQMCRFTKAEFIQGLQEMGADSIAGIRRRLEDQVAELRRGEAADQFKLLYRFTFLFGLEPGFRIVSLDMAVILWRLVFSVNTPAILERWLWFLEQHPNIRGVPKDTWNMFLNFAETVDITAYDDTEAWPSLFDDFVEYETDRTNQNESKAGQAGQATATATTTADAVGGHVL